MALYCDLRACQIFKGKGGPDVVENKCMMEKESQCKTNSNFKQKYDQKINVHVYIFVAGNQPVVVLKK